MNLHILIGHLGSDPKIHTFENGNKIANFSLATTHSYKNKAGDWINKTDWHNVVVSGPVVGYVEKHFKKGCKASLQGRSRQREYTGTDDIKRYTTEVIVEKISLEDKHQSATPQTPPPPTGNSDADDDLPFKPREL
ncbi:single-stranded DNA-binding protein [Seonamhaeicola sp.]|uniref:single-stranded DNA-binding protein n=1 Tax=Seonamhaeicola sp. TaxID=1912245 RepID=UPI00356560AC